MCPFQSFPFLERLLSINVLNVFKPYFKERALCIGDFSRNQIAQLNVTHSILWKESMKMKRRNMIKVLGGVFALIVVILALTLSQFDDPLVFPYIKDGNFNTMLSVSTSWQNNTWNANASSFVEWFTNGTLEMMFCGSDNDTWGNSKVIQGRTLWATCGSLMTSKNGEGVGYLKKGLKVGSYWLECVYRVVNRTFVYTPALGDAKANFGFDFSCSVNDDSLESSSSAVIALHFIDSKYVDGAFVETGLGWWAGSVPTDSYQHYFAFVDDFEAVGVWRTCRVDLGDFFNKAMSRLDGVSRLRVYGYQLYVEGVGTAMTVDVDKIEITEGV